MSFPDAPRIVSPPPGPRTRLLLEQQRRIESNARTYPRGIPIAPAEARGATVRDVDGNVFIDCLAGAGTLSVGHNNPVVVEAVEKLLASGHIASSLDFMTEPKARFIEALWETLPEELQKHGKIQFCGPTGTDATDAALKLVRTATGRHEVLSFQGGYHGMGLGPLSLMGSVSPKKELGALVAGAHFMPYAYCARCPLKLQPKNCQSACSNFVESVLTDPQSGVTQPAAIILEAIQGEGGSVVPPAGWLSTIAKYARQADVPLICDEIQSGLGRTGKWYAFDHDGVIPDVVLLSKAIGGMGLPLAVVVYHERLDAWRPGAHAGTFRGNQLAMAAGTAAIRFIQSEGLVERAAQLGETILSGLRAEVGHSPLVRDIRGKGLMLGVEFSTPGAARAARNACLERGVIIELGGRDDVVMRLLPPLVLTDEQAECVISVIGQAVRQAEREGHE